MKKFRVTFTVDIELADEPTLRPWLGSPIPESYQQHQQAIYQALLASPGIIKQFCLQDAQLDVADLKIKEFEYEEILARLEPNLPSETVAFLKRTSADGYLFENMEEALLSPFKTTDCKAQLEALGDA